MRLVSTNEKNPEFHPQLANPESPERGNAYSPLKGHAIAHSGTVIGLLAIVLWGFMAGLVRLVSESFGVTLGSALIYTVGGILLLVVRKPTPIRRAPRKYLIICGIMFVAYEASISLSIGLASTAAQSVEVSLVNYLWPTLLVLMTAAVSHKRGAVWKALPGAIVATIGVAMAVGGESLNVHEALRNISSNPLPYALAFAGAFIWAIYATVTPKMSDGYDGTTIFFCCVAVVLWLIHFTSGEGLPATAPGIGGYVALAACAASIAGGYACWGYGMLHGSMETLAIGSYATPLFSTASSTVLLGVALGASFWIGVALVVGGTLVNVWLGKPAPSVSVSGESDV
ncbi:Aromatic amino acid exporter YddG [Bifidobacterium catenulatum]|nr:Aromatic amino acid exporter YddG [Bifidobacterium catenulatum]